jgi:hypothetical protein
MDLTALLDIDTKRFKIQKDCYNNAKKTSPDVAKHYAEIAGIDKLLEGKN